MDGNRQTPQKKGAQGQGKPASIDMKQLRHLVQLLDTSDVSEIEVKRANEGTRLLLRKASASEGFRSLDAALIVEEEAEAAAPNARITISAPLVGIFHSWAKPRGGALVTVGDRIKAKQLVATIQSLNVMNDVESTIAGRVVEILVQDGQAVEYGQPLMVIDSAEEA